MKDGFMPHPFDLAHGVNTSGLVAGRNLKSGHRSDRHSTAYYGVAPSVFHSLLRRWKRTRPAARVEDTTFIDIGAGMGRAMLLAAEMPFRAVIGLELHPALVRAAKKNVNLWRRSDRLRAPIKLICGDASEFSFPNGPTVAFLFNPFGATAMKRFLNAVSKSGAFASEEFDLLYVNNEQEGVLESQRGFVRIFHGEVKRSAADARADQIILANQPDGEYTSADHEVCSIWRWMGR